MTGNPNGIRPAAESSESGRSMVCVVGAHSGVGVSTVSANLALCAQRGSLNRETALLDLNLYEGDLHLLLQLETEHPWRELMRDPLVLDPTLLMSVLVKHKTGLHLLASDYDGLREISVPPDKIGRLCSLAQSLFPTIVVDCGTVLNSAVTTALTSATTILLVTTLEVPAMRRAIRLMEALKALGHGRERVILVLNRSRRDDQGLQGEAEALIGQPIAVSIPDVPEDAREALETGRLLCAGKNGGAVVRAYERLAARVMDAKRAPVAQPTSWRARWIPRLWGDAA
ncbi:MAG: hypothetical protein WAU44_16515 [Nitrospira sp.]